MSLLPALQPSFEAARKPKIANRERTQTYATANGEFSFKLNKGPTIYGLDVRLSGTYTTPAAAAGTVRAANPSEMVSQFILEANEGDILINMSGLHAYVLQQLRRAKTAKRNDISSAEAALNSTASAFEFQYYLDLVELGVVPQHEGALVTPLFTDIYLKGRWGNAAAAIVDSAAAGTTVAAQLECGLRTIEHVNKSPIGYGALIQKAITKDVANTTDPAYQIPLYKGGFVHWLIIFTFTGAAKNLSDAVLTAGGKILVKVGNQVEFERTPEELKAMQNDLFPESMSQVGIYAIPFLHNDVAKTVNFTHQGLEAPGNQDVDLFLPLTGAANNKVEVLQVMKRAPEVSAGIWGLI